jgi:hypothetical protein
MLLLLTFNQFVVPLVLACFFALLALSFLVKVRKEAQKAAQLKRLAELKPPRKGQNHRSLPNRQYYLTRNMTKPTAEEEHTLEVYVKLYPEEARASQPH